MTEAEWLTCTDPRPMLEFLRGQASDRQLRWFAVACCRRIEPLLSKASNQALHVAELLADGLVGEPERKAARGAAMVPRRLMPLRYESPPDCRGLAKQAVVEALGRHAVEAAVSAAGYAAYAAADLAWHRDEAERSGQKRPAYGTPRGFALYEAFYVAERAVQVQLLRDLVGIPFRPAAD